VDPVAEGVGAFEPWDALEGPHRGLKLRHELGDPVGHAEDEGLGCVAGKDAAFGDESDPPAAGGLVHVGRRHQDRDPLTVELEEELPELEPGHGIDAGRRFVEQKDLGSVEEIAGQSELFLHPARKVPGEPVFEGPQGAETEQLLFPLREPPGRHAVKIGEELHVFGDGQVAVKAEVLGHVADPVLHLEGPASHIEAGDRNGSAVGAKKADEEAEERRFSRAVGSDEAGDRPLLDREVEVMDGLIRLERLEDAPGFDGVHVFPKLLIAAR